MSHGTNDLERAIRAIVEERVPSLAPRLDDLDQPLGLEGLGLDSVQLAEIMMMVESTLDVVIPVDWEPEGEITVNALVRLVENLRSSNGR